MLWKETMNIQSLTTKLFTKRSAVIGTKSGEIDQLFVRHKSLDFGLVSGLERELNDASLAGEVGSDDIVVSEFTSSGGRRLRFATRISTQTTTLALR